MNHASVAISIARPIDKQFSLGLLDKLCMLFNYMILGHDIALVRLHWAGDNLGYMLFNSHSVLVPQIETTTRNTNATYQ